MRVTLYNNLIALLNKMELDPKVQQVVAQIRQRQSFIFKIARHSDENIYADPKLSI